MQPISVNETQTPDRQAAARKSTLVSVVVNVLLTAGQIVAGVVSGSQGLVADGIHSLSDLVADFVVLLANRHSAREADANHPYGHHRFETAASFALGLLLLGVGAGMLWTAVIRLESPEDIPPVQALALYVALAALVVKEGLFRYMRAVAEQVRSTMLLANAWHARSDAASSLVVAVGIGGSLLGFPLLDPVAALIVGVMVGRMGWTFAWDALHDLMDRAASDDEIAGIRETLRTAPGVHGIHDMRTRKMGDLIVVDVHIEVDGDKTVREGHDIAAEARRRVMAAYPVLDVLTHLDPVEAERSGA